MRPAALLLGALLMTDAAARPAPVPPAAATRDDKPVYMVVAGPTHDRARMLAYGKAIADSGLYAKLGGYYVNTARPLAVFEGEPPAGYATLIVRFPSLANAKAFWFSREYQEKIKPLRLNPSAGEYTVTVYAEAELPPYMAGKVAVGAYGADFDAAAVPQLSPE